MAKKTFKIRRNRDNTITFRYERYVEHIDTTGKGMLQIYEAIKYAAVCADLSLNEDTLVEMLRIAQGLSEGGDPSVPARYHGTLTGYQAYNCRCPRCRKVRRDYDRARARA